MRKLRILYVTGLWDGLADALYDALPPRGMPAFHRPLQALVERGHQVDLLVGTPQVKPLHVECEWLKQVEVEQVLRPSGRGLRSLGALLALYRAVYQRLKQRHYDFAYCHGPLGPAGILASRRAGVPCAQRTYGTLLTAKLSGTRLSAWHKLRLWLAHPMEYMNFSLSKSFQLITNDGSRGDYVFSLIGDPQTPLYFWLNGTSLASDSISPADSPIPLDPPFLLYPARIAPWKQQHLALELLSQVMGEAGSSLRLVYAGHEDDAGYLESLKQHAQKASLSGLVVFLGPVTPPLLRMLMERSLAVLSFYNLCNLGNVAIEALSYGSVLISLNDGSLESIVRSGESAFLVRDMREGARVVGQLLVEPSLVTRVQTAARQAAQAHFPTWEERVAREADLIEQAATRGQVGAR